MRFATTIIALLFVCVLGARESAATTFVVSNSAEFNAAVTSAADGDTIIAAAGSYEIGHSTLPCITIKGMTGDPADVTLFIYVGLGEVTASAGGTPFRLEDIRCYGVDSGPSLLSGDGVRFEFLNCIIESCVGIDAGVLEAANAEVVLVDSWFEHNVNTNGTGGAFHLVDGTATATGCTFTRNMSNISGGVFAMTGGSVDLSDCTFLDNTGFEGGGALELTGVSGGIVDCTFVENETRDGGSGLKLTDCTDLTLSQVTISRNEALGANYAGLMILGSSAVTLDHCGIGNSQAESPADGYLAAGASVLFRCCEVDLAQWRLDGTYEVDDEGCVVPAEERSFGDVKAMYR